MKHEQVLAWGHARSCIRELAEYGAVRKKEIGAENVYDFSLGNPSIPAPESINQALADLATNADSIVLHGYTTAAGRISLREKIAENLNRRFGLGIGINQLYVTCGAAASLTISLNSVLEGDEEVITQAPFFPEYRVFTEAAGGKLVVLPPEKDFELNLDALEKAINVKTRAVIINSPNNPSGAIISEDKLKKMGEILRNAEKKVGHPIYLMSDEPYRELVYTDEKVCCPLCYYDDSIMCYSFSKSLSLPGERIGYIALNSKMQNVDEVYAAVLGAGRALGFVNPPSTFQQVIEKCIDSVTDISAYKQNRDLLCSMLSELGYEYIEPKGAFYLFVKALEPDAKQFSEKAKKHELLLVPSDDFGCPGYIRIAYCVSYDMIKRSRSAFEALRKEYK